MPERPRYFVISNQEDLEASKVDPDTLKETQNICEPMAPHFEGFDIVGESLLKPTRLAVEKVIGDLSELVVERNQKGLKAFYPTLLDLPVPLGGGARGHLLALFSIDGSQFFA